MSEQTLDNKEMLESSDNFETAYRSHSGAIYKFLYWRTGNAELSQDLTSTTFEKAWTARKNFKSGSEKAWLYRIARNTLIDHWRKNKELPLENIDSLESDSLPLAEKLDKQLDASNLRKAVNKLPKDMKAVINLRFIEGLSSAQAAKLLDITPGNVRVLQYRALKKMKEYLK